MAILTEEVLVRCHSKTANYYQELGYDVPKKENGNFDFSKSFMVKICHLPKNSHTLVLVQCDNCKTNKNISFKEYNKHNHNGLNYCQKCSCAILNSGEQNHNYKVNKTNEERQNNREYAEYKLFVKRVMARDNYTCYCCKKRVDGQMIVHHLNGYDWCIEERVDDNNGITLCENCHKHFHQQYGYGNNTKEQFETWIKETIILLNNNIEIEPYKKVYCYETQIIYDNEMIAERETKVKKEYIRRACNKTQQTAKDLHFCWYDDFLKMNEEEKKQYINQKGRKSQSKQVICLDTMEIFNSLKEAGEKYGNGNRSSGNAIGRCCNGYTKTAYNKHWQYYNIEREEFF